MKLPAGPQTHPYGQLIQWIADPPHFMNQCAQQYGDLFTVRWGSTEPAIMVHGPEAMQIILDEERFEAPGRMNKLLIPLVGQQSMFLIEGESHKRRRRLVMPSLHGERMRNYGDQIGAIIQAVTSQWQVGQPVEIRPVMQEITLRVIMHVVFGLEAGERYQQIKPLLASIIEMVAVPIRASLLFFRSLQRDWGVWSPWGQFLHQQQQLDQILYAEIAERRATLDPNRTDILTLMMLAQDENGESMTDTELRDELLTLLLAGHETTATALTWAFYWIYSQPSVREKLTVELDSLPENADSMTYFRLPYLTAVCQETLRINPVGMLTFPRTAKEPMKLFGHSIEPGQMILGSIYLTHQRSDLYPNPQEFRPERFLQRQFSPYEFIPFGIGSRRCIGMALAQFEMKLVLAKVLQTCELELIENRPVRPRRRGITLGLNRDVRMRLTGRRHPQQVHKVSETLSSV